MKKKRNEKITRRPLNEKVRMRTFEITTAPLESPYIEELPPSDREKVKNLLTEFNSSVRRNPREAIPRLEQLAVEYPTVPQFINHLYAANMSAGNKEKAEEYIIEGYKRFPDYLFARIAYARYCLENDQPEMVLTAFNGTLDLQTLCPKRKRFHITEVTLFFATAGLYLIRVGKRENAEVCYNMLKQIAPNEPATRELGNELFPSPLQRFLTGLLNKLPKD